MTEQTHTSTTQPRTAFTRFHAKRSDQRSGESRRRTGRRSMPYSALPIDELIWLAIADQPPQLYRGGA